MIPLLLFMMAASLKRFAGNHLFQEMSSKLVINDVLKNKISNYKKNRQEKIDFISKKKIDATSKLLKEITPILTEYSQKNKISIILKKIN